MIAFVDGKRILVDKAAKTVLVQGRLHGDCYPWGSAKSRVRLYEGLRAKHSKDPNNQFYVASLAAAKRAAEMVEQAEAEADDAS